MCHSLLVFELQWNLDGALLVTVCVSMLMKLFTKLSYFDWFYEVQIEFVVFNYITIYSETWRKNIKYTVYA